MKRFVGIVIVVCFGLTQSVNCHAIPINIDSLRLEVRAMPDDTLKVIKLADLSKKYIKYQIDTSYNLSLSSVRLSQKLEYKYGNAYAFKQLGLVYKYLTEYDSALVYYFKSLNLFKDLNVISEKARLLNRIANIYKRQGKFEESLDIFLSALDISITINDSVLISAIYNNVGVLYYDMAYYDKALDYQMLNLAFEKERGSTNNIATILMNIGNIYKTKEYYDQAAEYYKQALVYLEKEGSKYDQLLLLHNMGAIYEENYKLTTALEYYNKALALEKEINYKELTVYTLQGIGNVYIKMGNFNVGIRYLENSYDLAEKIGDLRKMHVLSSNLYKEYEKHGDYKKSFQYLKKYVQIEDSIFAVEGKKQIVELEQKYEAEKRQQQIAFLEKEKEIQQLQLSKSKLESKQKSLQRNILILILIFASGFVFFMLKENKKRKKKNLLLVKQNKKITEQRTEIGKQNDSLLESNKTKDQLFQIIAHDLRGPMVSVDSITQLIPFWVEEQDYESLKKLSKTLELSVNNVLSLIDNLLNWALNQQGKFPYKPENLRLKKSISESIEVYRPIAEIKNIELKFEVSKDVIVFADRNMFFTVMRNLLNNAVKFTPEGGIITIGIGSNAQFAKVWVKDSGIGISEEKKNEVFSFANNKHELGTQGETGKGLGLFFCKEFVSMNNGDIFVDSEPGEGTTITFTLPLFNIAEN